MQTHQAFISLGSNIGAKKENCLYGLEGVLEQTESELVKLSPFYRTSPVDFLAQDWFVNAVAKIKTTLDPFELLEVLKKIEINVGRKTDKVRFGPRVLDMDIIFFDDRIIQTDRLVIPHKRMHKRRFVLQPICDIEPTMMHPVLASDMQSLLDNLHDNEQEAELIN